MIYEKMIQGLKPYLGHDSQNYTKVVTKTSQPWHKDCVKATKALIKAYHSYKDNSNNMLNTKLGQLFESKKHYKYLLRQKKKIYLSLSYSCSQVKEHGAVLANNY